eukprot:TRINITY_DN604_c0_g1_i1.p1 TRINITY_DN604_c0_g1~~TRINITY_DN604_c0_g1_i1.p1  ORF type:complete len:208 (-),score=28.42 TRINITY_DN604_c0_g1_i1:80-679(-)
MSALTTPIKKIRKNGISGKSETPNRKLFKSKKKMNVEISALQMKISLARMSDDIDEIEDEIYSNLQLQQKSNKQMSALTTPIKKIRKNGISGKSETPNRKLFKSKKKMNVEISALQMKISLARMSDDIDEIEDEIYSNLQLQQKSNKHKLDKRYKSIRKKNRLFKEENQSLKAELEQLHEQIRQMERARQRELYTSNLA